MEQNAASAHPPSSCSSLSTSFTRFPTSDARYQTNYKDNPECTKRLDARTKEMQTAIDQSLNK